MTTRTYEIVPRPPEDGGGWLLRLIEDGQEVGGGVFMGTSQAANKDSYGEAVKHAEDWLASAPGGAA